jgi:hypothetical protein
MITKTELPAPYSSVEVLTQTDLFATYLWLKQNSVEHVTIAKLGEISFYAKLPRRNDRTGNLVFGFSKDKFSIIHWDRSVFVASAMANRWDREARTVVQLQSTIDAALALKQALRAA